MNLFSRNEKKTLKSDFTFYKNRGGFYKLLFIKWVHIYNVTSHSMGHKAI